MPNIDIIKEREVVDTPLLLFDCQFKSGQIERWSTHTVTYAGNLYRSRVQNHTLFELRFGPEDLGDSTARLALTLANADSYFSQIERTAGWKGARLTARFVFFDLEAGTATSESRVVYSGLGSGIDELTETTIRVSFHNRLSLHRLLLPQQRIQRRCPWIFPATAAQRQEGVDGGTQGKYSPFYRCGYSADVSGGTGNLNGTSAFTSCDYTRGQCEARGMFQTDSAARGTARFGGIEFLPPSSDVHGFGEGAALALISSESHYNDVVPLVYGTGWHQPPIVQARTDGRFTRMEALVGSGRMQSVQKILVNRVEIPELQPNRDMAATGWYRVVHFGDRNGAFDPDFANDAGTPVGTPFGSMAYLSIVVPSQIHNGAATPRLDALVDGLQLGRFDVNGTFLGDFFTNNPAWILLDILRRTGWTLEELDIPSFATVGQICDELIPAQDMQGNGVLIPRYRCNLILRKRRSVAELLRGIKNSAGLYFYYGPDGKLRLGIESSLAVQQPVKPSGSNSVTTLNGGWPAYEFGDGTNGLSGIARRENGAPSLRLWGRGTADTPNRMSIEFQDEFNLYQQDSLSVVDADDSLQTGYEVSVSLPSLGITNFHHASRAIQRQLAKSIHGNLYAEFLTSVRGVTLSPGDIITITYLKEGLNRQPFRVLRLAPDLNYRTLRILAQLHDDNWYNEASGSLGNAGLQPNYNLGLPRPLLGNVMDSDGAVQFSIEERTKDETDGSSSVILRIGFSAPANPVHSSAGIPRLSLSPQVFSDSGTLGGGQTLYYGVTGADAQGRESGLSFLVRAQIGGTGNTNRVMLTNLSFSAGTASLAVYRGDNPWLLKRIASNVVLASSFTDTGFPDQLIPAPDENYHHANVYWRLELQPPIAASVFSSYTIGNSSLNMLSNEFSGQTVRITKGKGLGQERGVVSHTTTTLTVTPAWTIVPDSTSEFSIAESGWHFGAAAESGPVEVEVPNRKDATVHISGRAANAKDQENAASLSPVTRWRIGGSAGNSLDFGVPVAPAFGLSLTGQGTAELVGVSFSDLTNTRTVEAGTLTLYSWNELLAPCAYSLATSAGPSDSTVSVTPAGTAQAGDLIQIESEILQVDQVASGGTEYQVTRGIEGSTAAAHAAATKVFHLSRKIVVVAFPRDFFGSPASGSYAHSIFLPDSRIAAADFYVTNSRGSSPVKKQSFTATSDAGLRTLSGGQFSIQVEGYLAIQTSAAPPLIVEDAHSVRDIFATMKEAPIGAPVQIEVKQNGAVYASLTIAAGATVSNVVGGFDLPPLIGQALVTLDIVSVGQAAGTTPGRDLTVTIRL
ncbi:MAG: hypothetical protein HY235_01135 [Acidobacteria bacterium]|nr:hypothetical protein [Acidobacteriota bacterium]